MTDHPMCDRAGYKSMSINAGGIRIETPDGSVLGIEDDTKLGDSQPAFTLSIQTDAGFQHIRITKRAAEYLMGWMSTKDLEYSQQRRPLPKANP